MIKINKRLYTDGIDDGLKIPYNSLGVKDFNISYVFTIPTQNLSTYSNVLMSSNGLVGRLWLRIIPYSTGSKYLGFNMYLGVVNGTSVDKQVLTPLEFDKRYKLSVNVSRNGHIELYEDGIKTSTDTIHNNISAGKDVEVPSSTLTNRATSICKTIRTEFEKVKLTNRLLTPSEISNLFSDSEL